MYKYTYMWLGQIYVCMSISVRRIECFTCRQHRIMHAGKSKVGQK